MRDCREYDKTEILLLDGAQLPNKLMHNVKEQKFADIALISRTDSINEPGYTLVAQDEIFFF